jgi:hypothetical protein
VSEFKKYDQEKCRFDLYPPSVPLPARRSLDLRALAYRAVVGLRVSEATVHLVELIGDDEVARGMVGLVMHYGAKKYGPDNWKGCEEPMRYMWAARRHLLAMSSGEANDPESGLPHVAHALCCCVFYRYLTETV